MAKQEAFLQFLKAARSLQDRGLSKEAIVQFAKNQFGELSELFKKQIDSLFKPKKGIENIKLKDEVFDDTVIKLPIDDTGVPFNPKDPTKQYGKPKKSRMLDEDEIAELDMDIGGLEYTNDFDGTVESANKLRKERADYIRDMEIEYKKGNLDPGPGEANRERFLQKKFDEMEASGDNRLMTRDEIEELSSFDLQKDMDKSVEKFKKKDAKQKKIIKDFDPGDRDPSAEGGIIGYYTGGMVDVEPNLSDIGHGSDALMARTRLMSPGSQATTSTGLNYLLAEDNDNIRVPFGSGGSYDYGSMQYKIDSVKAAYRRYKKGSQTGGRGGTMTFEQFAPIWAKENFATGGRAGFANGNGVADEDAEKAALGKRVRELMDEGFDIGEAVKKAMSEGYAEGGRIGFSKGKIAKEVLDKGRRGFMKTAGVVGAGIAALKTGLLGFGKEAAPVVEKVAETASNTIGQAPAYFLNLVQKIKNLGDDAPRLATKDREKVTTYKDYTLTEDVTTGEQTIQRMKLTDDGSEAYYGQPLTEETYMSYKPGKGLADETTKGKTPPDEYEEGTAYLRNDRGNTGEIVEESATISDDVIEEGTKFEDNLSDFGKADGGRIGFSKGNAVLKGLDYLKELFKKKDYLEEFPRVDIEKLMKGDKPIKLYSGVGDRQANTLKAYKEDAKFFNTTVDKIKKDNFKGQWFTPFKEYASGFGNARNINSKMLTTELTPKEIKMAKRYVDKVNKKDRMVSTMKMKGIDNPPKYNITTDDNTVIIPRIKLKKLKEEGKINTDYMVLDKIKSKLGLAEGGVAGILGE